MLATLLCVRIILACPEAPPHPLEFCVNPIGWVTTGSYTGLAVRTRGGEYFYMGSLILFSKIELWWQGWRNNGNNEIRLVANSI